jgi:hypothetical protein
MKSQLNPSHILQTGFAFWTSKVLLSAVKLELFTVLANKAFTGTEIETKLGLHPRATYDFLELDCADSHRS